MGSRGVEAGGGAPSGIPLGGFLYADCAVVLSCGDGDDAGGRKSAFFICVSTASWQPRGRSGGAARQADERDLYLLDWQLLTLRDPESFQRFVTAAAAAIS